MNLNLTIWELRERNARLMSKIIDQEDFDFDLQTIFYGMIVVKDEERL